MNAQQRRLILEAIKSDEAWIARARAAIEPAVDCSSIEEDITVAEQQVARMRELLA
jgi:hypothetical protein